MLILSFQSDTWCASLIAKMYKHYKELMSSLIIMLVGVFLRNLWLIGYVKILNCLFLLLCLFLLVCCGFCY